MYILAFVYLGLGFGGVAALSAMILNIGRMVRACPETGAASEAAAVTIATGFAAIGGGGVILIGAGLPMLAHSPLTGFLLALGFAALCLGLGFTHAVGTLRVVILEAKRRGPPALPA